MAKVAIVVFSDIETPEALGKLLNAFLLAGAVTGRRH